MVHHFQEDGRINQTGLLPIEVYSQCLDYLAIACVDVIFFNQGQLLLGKRKVEPKKGWWVIGGRIQAGESPTEAVVRKIKQEASLQLRSSRFQFLNVYSTCFAKRSQPPRDHGLHSINLVYLVQLTEQERKQVVLTAAEYEDWGWFNLEALQDKLDLMNALDVALLTMAQEAFARV